MRESTIVDLHHIGRGDIPLVGNKAANLGEMLQARLPVPSGFVVTDAAWQAMLKSKGLGKKIDEALRGLDPAKAKALHAAAKTIQKAIDETPFPAGFEASVTKAYQTLTTTVGSTPAVAVRPSLAADDAADHELLGQSVTYLQVVGAASVLKAIREVWRAFFESSGLQVRLEGGRSHHAFRLAVVVQSMISADRSGVLFSSNPVSGNADEVVIEAAFGLGEALVLGAITPDHYVVSATDKKVITATIRSQPWQLVRAGSERTNGTRHQSIAKKDQRKRKVTDTELLNLAALGKQLEGHFYSAQIAEWTIDPAGTIWLVDTWALETIEDDQTTESVTQTGSEVLVRGLAGAGGVASGPVRIIHHPRELAAVRQGEILVVETATPAYFPAFDRAVAVVSDTGGVTSHAVVAARERGIPCVAGAGTATHTLKNGVVVTVDGGTGRVYKGKVTTSQRRTTPTLNPFETEIPVTGTKLYVNLSHPDQAEAAAKLPVDGVGLLRAEFLLAELGGHPRYLLKEKKEHWYVQKLADGMRRIAEAFAPRPVVYRATDFKTNEFRALPGGDKIEPREENPMLGYRGALRYIREPDLFALELAALKTVRESYNLKNLWLMLPFVRTVEELTAVRGLIEPSNLLSDPSFKLWMMVEVPSNVLMLEDFLAAGLDGLSIGSNDLTQLLLGVDRDNARLSTSFDERHPAVMGAMRHVVALARRHHTPVSLCGNAASTYPEVVEALIRSGITSLSVTPDTAVATRRMVASIERRMLLDRLTDTANHSQQSWSY